MKKLGRLLTTLALSAPLLSGCSLLDFFSDLPEETKEVNKLDLRDYTSSVALNTKYEFDGKVYLMYADNTEKEITSSCSFRDVDTSKVGKTEFRVDYETKSRIYYTVTSISVYDPSAKSELQSISVSNYTDTVEKGASYTFDGTVKAKYKGIDGEIVVKLSDCRIDTLDTSTTGSKSITIRFSDTYNDSNGVAHEVEKTATATIKVIAKPTAISATAIQVGLNRQKQISLTYTPSDTTEKDVTYVSNNTSVATVDASGVVTGKGSVGQSTTITVTSKVSPSVSTTVNVSIVEIQQDEWTILMYVCGSDLESDSSQGGQATEDLKEVASVAGQPEDVNIVVQAGGASSWKSTYSSVINKDKRNRFHLKNKSYVKDSQDSKVNMGLASSLQDFITWGITTYPADKIGLIFWNHGGAMTGCCFDEQYDDCLTPAEVSSAVKAAKQATGYADKFEFIGYDCCLMQVQDIAGLNSEYANYQVASEESEWGYGWTYDEWVDDLFAKKSTETILTAIVDSFKSETISVYGSGSQNDQTLSYLDLSKWGAYETAWESMASTLSEVVTSSSQWNTLASLLNTCQRFGQSEVDYWGTLGYPFDVFDVGSFCSKIKASSSYKNNTTLMSKIAGVESAYSLLVSYEWHGGGSSGATGLTLFAPVSGYSATSDYSASQTTLSTWRSICVHYGSFQ